MEQYTLPDIGSNVLISSVTGGGAETVAKLLCSSDLPWYRGDGWGSRPSGQEDEWTYRYSDWSLPSRPSVISLTDGSDIAPWLMFRTRYPSIPIVRLVAEPSDILNWKNRWRAEHGLPKLKRLGTLAYAQRLATDGSDLLLHLPDAHDDPRGFDRAMRTIKDFIVGRCTNEVVDIAAHVADPDQYRPGLDYQIGRDC